MIKQPTKNRFKRLFGVFLSVCLLMGTMVFPKSAAYAKGVNDLVQQLNGWTGKGNGDELIATIDPGDENTIIVTGLLSNVSETLKLDIDEDVIINWKAIYSGVMSEPIIEINGDGTFDVSVGGSIENGGNGSVIYHPYAYSPGNPKIIVSGGHVNARGSDSGNAIEFNGTGDVTVTGGSVTSDNYHAIDFSGMTIGNGGNYTVTTSDSNITVNGGEVVSYAVSTGGHGIVVGGSNSIVNIEGDALVQAGSQFGILVNTDAVNVEININGGTVKSNGYAICLNGQGEINVNGGTVEGSGAGIYLAGTTDNKTTVNIESGTVQSTGNNGKTITTKSSTVDINISGGKVIASGINSWAISDSDGKKPTNVKLSGGQVIANNISAYGIYLSSQNSAIDITGGDIIISNGAAYGIVTMNSTIKMTGGRIISTDIGGMAIWSLSTADLVIEGGVVLGRGEKLPDVVYGGGFTTPSGDGVVIVWDKSDDSNVHEKDMSTHLTVFPQGAKAVWNDTGIDYTDASGNKTFIDLGEKYSTLFAPVITTDKLTSGEYDSSYILKVEATGGEPITFSATGLPNGLSIDSDGNITGTPTQAGDFSVEITATNAVATDTKTLGLLIKKIVAPEPTELSKTPEAIYGDTLSDVKLSDWTGWTWKDSTQSVGNVSETGNKFVAVFTPADTDNYNTIEKALTVVVIKADPSLTIPTGLEATYGDTLSDVKLSDWTGWTWKDSTQSVGNVSETGNKFVAVFTPENENYNPIEKELPVIVKPLELTDALAISEDVTYTGEKQEPKVTVTLGDITLIDEVDYVVTYGDETDVGNGTYTVTFKGNYSGTIDGSYNIEATKAMEDFEEELNKLPNEIKTKEDAEKVDEVKELYNNLTDGEKLQLSDDVVIKYDNALAAAKEFNDIDNSDSNGDSSGDSNNSNGDSDSSNSKDNSKNPSPNTGATLRLTACAMIMLAGVILATISSKRKKKN